MVVRPFITVIGLIAGLTLCVQAESKEYTFSFAERCDSRGILLKGPDGVSYVALPAEAQRFEQCAMDLKRTFPQGRYKIEYTLYSPSNDAPAVMLYAVAAGDKDMEVAYPISLEPGGTRTFTTYFYATQPFTAIKIKKAYDSAHPTQGIGQCTLTDMGQSEYPRLESYLTLMKYPAGWGLRSPVIQKKLNTAKKLISTNFDAAMSELKWKGGWTCAVKQRNYLDRPTYCFA